MKPRYLSLLLMVLLLLGACEREGSGRIELLIEPLGSATGTKLAVEHDTMAVWTDGDRINLNGTEVAISYSGVGNSSVSDVAVQDVNSACFPASLCTGDITAASVSVALPAEYHYRTAGGAQLLDMPMMARANRGDPLRFQHLTAALCVVLENPVGGVSLTVDRITVTSDAYQLSGSRTVDMTDIAATAPVSTSTVADRQVAMLFDREPLTLAAGATHKVLIPVPPVGSGNHFTISVSARHEGSRYTFSHAQTTGGALPRNMLAYAGYEMTGAAATALFDAAGSGGYYIRTASDLVALSDAANGGWTLPGSSTLYSACNYVLAADIDMTDVPFNMIANYTGTLFDGANHSISHLTIDGSGGYCALFKTSNELTIQNLTLNDVTLRHPACSSSSMSFYLGGLVAKANLGITLSSCSISGLYVNLPFSERASAVYMGGLVGNLNAGGTLTSCSATITSTAYDFDAGSAFFGSLVGNSEYDGDKIPVVLNNCVVNNSSLSISSTSNMIVGGMIGKIIKNNITEMPGCSWSSEINVVTTSATMPRVGRLIGQKQNSYCFIDGATITGSINVTTSGGTSTVTTDVGT